MSTHPAPSRRSGTRGSATVEFALIVILLFTVVFGSFEIDRLFLVYTTVANAARGAARYAIVHSGGGGVEGRAKDLARGIMLDVTKLNVTVTYPTGNNVGSRVVVQVSYPYDSWLIPQLTPTLSSTSEGVIVF